MAGHKILIYPQCRWIAGSDFDVLFWKDNWLGDSLFNFLEVDFSVWDLNSSVSDWLDGQGKWVFPEGFKDSFSGLSDCIRKVVVSRDIVWNTWCGHILFMVRLHAKVCMVI